MAKKLAKYELEALASQIASTIRDNNAKGASGKAGTALEKAQAQVDSIVAKMQPLIAKANPILAQIVALEDQLDKLYEKLEVNGLEEKYEKGWMDGLELDTCPADKKSFVTFNAPKIICSPKDNFGLQRDIEKALIIETMKKDFDVDQLMEKMVKRFS